MTNPETWASYLILPSSLPQSLQLSWANLLNVYLFLSILTYSNLIFASLGHTWITYSSSFIIRPSASTFGFFQPILQSSLDFTEANIWSWHSQHESAMAVKNQHLALHMSYLQSDSCFPVQYSHTVYCALTGGIIFLNDSLSLASGFGAGCYSPSAWIYPFNIHISNTVPPLRKPFCLPVKLDDTSVLSHRARSQHL